MGSTKIINVSRDDSFEEIFKLFSESQASEVIFVLPKRTKAFSKDTHFSKIALAAKGAKRKIALMTSNPQVTAMGRAYKFDVIASEPNKAVEPVAPIPHAQLAVKSPIYSTDDDEDVVIPSDERMGADEEGEEEDEIKSGMHVEEEDEPSEEDIEKELELDEEEKIEDESLPDDEDGEHLDDDERSLDDTETTDQELFAEDVAHVADGVTANLAMAKTMDGMVRAPNKTDKRISIKASREKPVRVDVGTSSRDESLDELAKVWQQEQVGTSLWSDIKKRSSSTTFSWPRIFTFGRSGGSRSALKKGLLWGSLVVAVLILGVVVYPSHAQIVIKPLGKKTSFSVSVNATDVISAIDVAFQKIPGQRFQISKSVTQTFIPTGEKDAVQKARGTITVVNAYAPTPQVLIATTRFESSQGLIFRTLRTISIPGSTAKGPGKIEVEVVADQPGAQYNIAADKFVVAAFKEKGDTARVEKIYGESNGPMHGGIQGRSKVVTQKDYAEAVDAITKQLRGEILSSLRDQASNLVIPDALSLAIGQPKGTASIDDVADSFSLTAEGSVTVIAFRKSDLEEFMKGYVDKKYGTVALPEKLTLNITDSAYDEAKSSQIMQVSVTGELFERVSADKIKSDLLGKGEDAIRAYLDAAPGVGSARVKFSPFWISSIPSHKDKVTVEIAY